MIHSKTLVGRMALLQVAVMFAALGLVVGLSFAGVKKWLERERDQNLLGVADRTLSALAQYDDSLFADTAGFVHEVEEHRPEGTRVVVIETGGGTLATVGDGPPLRATKNGDCEDQQDFRVCSHTKGRLAILAGKSMAAEAATVGRLFWLVLGIAALVLALIGALSRFVARRGLLPLAVLSSRLAAIEPGNSERLGLLSGLREIDDVAIRFDELLRRIDDAMARERRFSAQASHELRTPLTVLRGELELSLREPELSALAASRALASAETMARLLDVLLLFGRAESRFQAKDLEVVNLCDLVRDLLAQLVLRLPDDSLRISAALPEEGLVLGEQHLLLHAVTNLIDNAFKHTPKTSAVEVAVRILSSTLELRVADEGPGISPEHANRIFEPFFRDPISRARSDGHGLGLPFARSVARAHGGDVWWEESPTKGSVFVLQLPLAENANIAQ